MITIEDGRKRFYQWDLNQRLLIEGYPVGTQVHFASRWADDTAALVVEAYADGDAVYADIPNILLQTAGELCAYIYTEADDRFHTDLRTLLTVSARERPSDYVYTETEVMRWEDLEARVIATAEATTAAITTANSAASNANSAADAANAARAIADAAISDANEAAEAALAAATAVGDEIDGIVVKDEEAGIAYLAKFRLVGGKPALVYNQIT